MKASEYAYGVARVRAKRAFMLKVEDYEALLRAPAFHQALAQLQPVSDLARDAPQTSDPRGLERHLSDRFLEILRSVSKTVKGDARLFLEAAFSKYEYETLKALLKAKFMGLSEEETWSIAPPMGIFSGPLYSSMVSARGVEQAVELIPQGELKAVVKEALKDAAELKTPLPLETRLDKWFYLKLWGLAKKLRGSDGEWATHLVGVEVDVKNIMVLLRGKELNLQPAALDGMFLPISYKLQLDLSSLAPQPLPAVLQALYPTYYGAAVSPLAKDSREVERNLQILWVNENESVFLHYPFTVGSIYAYANLKHLELKDLRALLLSKLLGVPAERVAPLMVRFAERLSA
ncbi:MAG: V-type ATPase subunit [Candidatus Nezhaarchaeota archaeon]|nr:V-type ATPase subunit [Candidatus Nezhaarchaeota archaeon]